VGRGEASKGKTAGRGTKAPKARYRFRRRFEGGQCPSSIGCRSSRASRTRFRTIPGVNLDKLATLYPEGGEVTVADLSPRRGAEEPVVKVLGTGEIDVALQVTGTPAASGSAKEKIGRAGGHRDRTARLSRKGLAGLDRVRLDRAEPFGSVEALSQPTGMPALGLPVVPCYDLPFAAGSFLAGRLAGKVADGRSIPNFI